MIKILHLSDIHLGSGFAHGKINPETGLNTRLEDFVATLGKCIDRAIAEPVDLVLFGGDAFPDATPPPYIQQAFSGQFRRLADVEIPVVLLVGNHDQHSQGAGGASLCIYRTLGVPHVVVGDRLETHRIQTRNGDIQVITLPWLTRSTLLTRPETEGLSMSEVGHLLLDRLRAAMEGEIRRLDPAIPTVLLAHLMVDAASYGAERFLAVGKGFTIPLEFLTRDAFDYVALGHVHRHQILSENPFVVYPGSIERVDFSEEHEDKGYVLVEIGASLTEGVRGSTTLEFCPLPARSFCTIELDLTESDDPHSELLAAIENKPIEDAVVRVIYQVRPEQIDLIDDSDLHTVLSIAHTYTIQAGLLSQMSRSRLPELGVGSAIEPLDALRAYLANREDLKLLAEPILEAAKALLAEEEFYIESDAGEMEVVQTQLKLL
ncbi:exonuclease subunit SbcD [Cyanobacteria bacterium FACHB-63]|nr:exonuclease subunit SbcD [Cyanobacteria bacterium FACHB-63]